MLVIEPKFRPRPFRSANTHARLRHDYATWHPDHLQEVLRDRSNRLPFTDKSKFDSATIIDDAITKSYEYPAIVTANGNHLVVFDMGFQVGFDAVTERRTSTVTVVIAPSGEVITAYPGAPWSKTPM